ncbi:hypothetical protein JB92DRAFT_2918755, partial [Gautieria morchelliformis]
MPTSQRKKASQKSPPAVSECIRRHFKSLVAQIDGGHLKNAIKTCDKILRLEPNDPDALQTKLSLLLHTDQHASALAISETLMEGEQQTTFPLVFGKAYALYRLSREVEAHDIVQNIKPQGDNQERGVMHMKAQIEYRRGDYQQAQNLYSEIFDSSLPHSDEQSDSLTNLTASQTHLDFLQAGFLRSLHSLPQALIGSLEDAPPPPLVSPHPVLAMSTRHVRQQAPTSAKAKVRVSRVPKGVVPGVTPPPDPERWLKKSERTNAHYHGSKRKKAVTGATQGSLDSGTKGGSSGKGKKKR